jgi:membrane associated rhomboid family serine protease
MFAGARITRGALYLLIAEVGVSLVFLMSEDPAKSWMEQWLTANADQVWHDFKVWTLITTAILQHQLLPLLFHGLILWMFVPTLERWWGTKKLLLFALWTTLAGTIAGTLLGLAISDPTPIEGLDSFIFGSIIAFGVLYADRPVQFFGVLPLTGKQLMYGIIGFVALFLIIGAQWVVGAAYAASMALAWLLSSGRWNPRLWRLRWKQRRVRRHLNLVRDDDDPKTWLN